MKIERRTIPGETPEAVERELNEVVRVTGEEATVTCFFDRPPLVCDRNEPIVACVRDAVTQSRGSEPVEAGVGVLDGRRDLRAGRRADRQLRAVTAKGAHADVEWVDLASVVQLRARARACGGGFEVTIVPLS